MTRFAIDETHDPALESWVESANGHADFPVQNLPFGIFSAAGLGARPGVAIGDSILDLRALADAGLLDAAIVAPLQADTLNALLAQGRDSRLALRRRLSALLTDRSHATALTPHLHPADDCTLHLPLAIGDYTDFYVGIHHAMNIGRLFRPDAPLLPNYKHVPIGYHGRASSIRPSGEAVVRPLGQRKAPDAANPTFGPSVRLDYELELGIWIAQGNELGRPVPIGEAADRIGGFCLLNDWSARDLQAWEYQPLGPFLAKNFHSTISPWVVTPEALAPFWAAQKARPDGDPAPLPYLDDAADQRAGALAVDLSVTLTSARMRETGVSPVVLSRTSAAHMYWTAAQIIAHHASNGCNLRTGDLLGTGTISAPDREGFGSLMEITAGGKTLIDLPTGEQRSFLEDGDEIRFFARASAPDHVSIGFGPCAAVILPAPSP